MSGLKKHICDAQHELKWFTPPELALGWYEGLQFLIDNDQGSFKAFGLACDLHDIESAALLLSADSAMYTTFYAYDSNPYNYGFLFDKILDRAVGNLTAFRLAAEELWKRREELRAAVLTVLQPGGDFECLSSPTLGAGRATCATASTARQHLKTQLSPGSTEHIDCFISSTAHYSRYYRACHHQILFDVGFVDVNTACGLYGSPLASACMAFPQSSSQFPSKRYPDWCENVLWLLKAGANPRFYTDNDWHHVQFFLAVAANIGIDLNTEFSAILGSHDSGRLHDACFCPCSSAGCIPAFTLWRDHWPKYPLHGGLCRKRMNRRLHNLRKWIKYWEYSRMDKEFIYREICRLELFERLGMTHLCCVASRFVSNDERRHLEMESETHARNLSLILHFYTIIRRCCADVPLESFWAYWWYMVNGILVPLRPEEACNGPYIFFEKAFGRWPSNEQVESYRNDLADARDMRWDAALKAAGYSKDWDFQDVIRDHCTKMLVKARAYKQRKAAYKRHRLVVKPRFFPRRCSESLGQTSRSASIYLPDSDGKSEWEDVK